MATLRTSDAPALQASLDPLPTVVLPEKMETQRLRGTQRCLRWPILLAVGLIITIEMITYVVLRILVHLWEKISRRFTRSRKLKQRMAEAQTFEEWCKCARELDVLEKREQWKRDPVSAYYDHPTLQRLQKDIRQKRDKNDMKGLMRTLRTVYCKGNVAGIDSEEMYSQTHWGTKYLIHDFIKEVLEATILLRDTTEVDELTKLKFFRKIKRSYGRTALLLSGGASFGYYHLGVIKTLFEANCLPKVISGTSAGSMIAALVGVRKDDELRDLFRPEVCQYFTACEEPTWVKVKRFFKHGALFDPEKWAEKMQIAAMGNITFEEAYRRTGRILNITTTPLSKYVQPLLLNHITAPNVIIWSAVLASCAVPSVLTPVELLEKDENGVIRPFHMHGNRFSDGSIKHDVPVADVAEKHNVNYFIVSQVNPHVVLFVYDAHGSSGEPSPHRFGSRLRGGFVSATLENLLKLEMRKWLQLIGNLDLLPLVLGQDWRYLFTQVSSGTVSIYPKPALRDYVRLLTDPDYESMERFLILSERNTWPKLSRISNHFIFESTLRACERYLTHRLRDREKVSIPKQLSDKLQVASNGQSKPGRKSPLRPPAPSPSQTDVSSAMLDDDSDDQNEEKQSGARAPNGAGAERTDLRKLLSSGGDWEDTAESGDESESGEGLLFNWDSRPNGEPAAEIGDADQGSEEDGRSSEDFESNRVDLSAVAETVKSRGRSRQRPVTQQRVGSSSV